MGQMCYYKCDSCNYNVETVCGYSVGMIAVLETYVCKDCNILTDVLVGQSGMRYPLEDIKEFASKHENYENESYYKCDVCSGENIELWNTKMKKCPKCKHKMCIDWDKPFTNWD